MRRMKSSKWKSHYDITPTVKQRAYVLFRESKSSFLIPGSCVHRVGIPEYIQDIDNSAYM